jgi:hypothetical protein
MFQNAYFNKHNDIHLWEDVQYADIAAVRLILYCIHKTLLYFSLNMYCTYVELLEYVLYTVLCTTCAMVSYRNTIKTYVCTVRYIHTYLRNNNIPLCIEYTVSNTTKQYL